MWALAASVFWSGGKTIKCDYVDSYLREFPALWRLDRHLRRVVRHRRSEPRSRGARSGPSAQGRGAGTGLRAGWQVGQGEESQVRVTRPGPVKSSRRTEKWKRRLRRRKRPTDPFASRGSDTGRCKGEELAGLLLLVGKVCSGER